MRTIFKVNRTTKSTDIALLIARVGIAALMLSHGIPKLIMLFSEGPVQFPPVMGMSAELSLGLAVFAEVFCSLFILAGFATRLATLPLIITMLVAVLFIHASHPFAKQEPALQYLLVYATLLFAGSGKYSIDYLLKGARVTESYKSSRVQDATLATYQ